MTASQYGICTIAELEAVTCEDYSAFVSSAGTRRYSDTNIEAWISQAERIVCAYLGKDYNSTAPQQVKLAVLELAGVLANNQLVKDGVIENGTIITPIITPNVQFFLSLCTPKEQSLGRIKYIVSVEKYTRA